MAVEVTPVLPVADASGGSVAVSKVEKAHRGLANSPQPKTAKLPDFASLAATTVSAPDLKPEWSSPERPLFFEAERLTSPAPLAASDGLSAQKLDNLPSMERFEPAFAQAIPVQPPSAAPPVTPLPLPNNGSSDIPPSQLPLPLEEGEVLGQVDDSELDEAELIDNEAEEILDNSVAPAGDLLESVDGLEDRGIAGEGVGEDTQEASSENPGEEECLEQEASDCEPASGISTEQIETDGTELFETESEALDNSELETEEFDSEEFDSEEFDAEEFDFEAGFEDEEAPENEPGSNAAEASENEETGEGDPDLGVLLLRPRPLAKKKSPLKVPVFLVGNVGYIANGNTLAGVDPVNDRLFRSGVSLIASPRLSKRTALIASVQGNLYRYDELSRLDYDELRFQTSLRHVITRRVYGDLGWTYRQLFLQESGDRFLNEHAAFANLTRRDPITKKTGITSFYNLRVSFADPETSSRLRNTLGASLRHDVTPGLQASLTGRATLTNFTQQSRQDFYVQGLAQLSYKISKNFRLSTFASLTRGNSSNRRVDFDNSTIGVSLSGNVKLF